MLPDDYDKASMEAALFKCGWTIFQEGTDDLTFYQTNFKPGGDLIIDWSKGTCEWSAVALQLEDQGIDSQPIRHSLQDNLPA